MTALKTKPARSRRGKRSLRPAHAIRVFRGQSFLGQVLLSADLRLVRRGGEVPPDVALKILVQHTREGLEEGILWGRKDDRVYHWHLVRKVELSEVA